VTAVPGVRPPGRYAEHGDRSAPRLALTFDDGPGRLTEGLLDVLTAHGAVATFNVLGERIAGRERILRRALAGGNELGNHAFHHERLPGRPLEAFRQLRRTSGAVQDAVGVTPRTFRAPYGDVSPGLVRSAGLLGMTTVGWDVDPHDYEEPTAEEIHARVVDAVRPGSIVLLHDDRRALEPTVAALGPILEDLAGAGYELVTVSALLGEPSA
jgi:peptidoglycan/xylan/chitin deacetylase (PgdA/CDA1 family)